MADAYFVSQGVDGDRARWQAGPATAGPWSPQLQHGGPPNALAVTLASRTVASATGRDDLEPVRVASDFVGAVPVAMIDSAVRIVRVARSAAVVEVTLSVADRAALVSRVWFVRRHDTAGIAAAPILAPPVPDHSTASSWTFGYGASIDWRFVRGGPSERGPAAAWARARLPLIADDQAPVPGLARVALVADSSSGISAELDWSRWSFVNVDLDIHLLRPLDGEWVLLDAATTIGAFGSALARSTISDRAGVVGASLQTLVLAAIPTG